jgi:hypothetical protein
VADNNKIAEALDIKLSQFSSLPTVVQYENTMLDMPDEELGIESFFIPGESTYPTIGANAPAKEFGIYQINVVEQPNVGSGRALKKAQEIRSYFNRGTVLVKDEVNVRIVKSTIGPGLTSKVDQKYRVPVSVYYESYS